MYHQIAQPVRGDVNSERYCVPPGVFAGHMWFLRMLGYSAVGISDVALHLRGECRLPVRPIAITFDDGYENFYTDALPILRRFGFTATVYLVGGHIGGTNRWDEVEGARTARLMNESQVREIADGGMELGVHSLTHPHLTKIPRDRLIQEVAWTKGYLEEMTGRPMDSFCYPYGPTSYNKYVRDIVSQSGFLAACGCDPGSNLPDVDIWNLRRHFPKSYTNIPRFAALLGKMPDDYRNADDYWK